PDTECEKGKQVYYTWLQKMGLDDTQPYGPQQKESFRWAQQLIRFAKEDEDTRYYRVEALFPVSSMNDNLYTEEELERAARTLRGKPVNLNHHTSLEGVEIVDAEYEDGAVESVLAVDKEAEWKDRLLADMIDEEQILHVSIEATCRDRKVTPDGATCEGLVFTGLALLTRDTLPGVPLTRVMPLETIVEAAQEQVGRDACHLCGRKVSDYVLLAGQKVHIQCAVNFWQLAMKTFHFNQKEEKKELKKPEEKDQKEAESKEPKSDAERVRSHFDISDSEWQNLLDQERQDYIDQLPSAGTKKNQQEKDDPEDLQERLERLEAEVREVKQFIDDIQDAVSFSEQDGTWQPTENSPHPPQETPEHSTEESVEKDDEEELAVEVASEQSLEEDGKETVDHGEEEDVDQGQTEEVDEQKAIEVEETEEDGLCMLTREGFWQRFHQLRGEGLSRSDAFRVVSTEVIEAASQQQ
ncbi:MAG: hypothetical protein ACOC6G_02055, partial [Thermoproteota archaeon]